MLKVEGKGFKTVESHFKFVARSPPPDQQLAAMKDGAAECQAPKESTCTLYCKAGRLVWTAHSLGGFAAEKNQGCYCQPMARLGQMCRGIEKMVEPPGHRIIEEMREPAVNGDNRQPCQDQNRARP